MPNLPATVFLCVVYLFCGYEILATIIMILVHAMRIVEMHTP
jgi:hypothetical protein